ncbi:DNA-binding domain-containing protein [Tenacibaculum tangerinum]|uniref:DNA-binding domain-containing protein n=1 Tax=Tenacibaculum tangerinum TaxID=3038772 RepID=A0ABY8L1R6_9FLAO|nr:DNA-binding domain-containing protein [Tenacibaculum tangerinum]WGH75383.1 DNA-binding domain-containing protein [Tenacibaculum tangerinum]
MKYYLTENRLTEETNYVARVLTTRTINQDELIEKMLSKRNLVSKTDIVAVLNSYYEEIIESIEEGDNINLPLVNIGYSISGVFETEEDSFNADIHKLHVNLNGGKLINEIKESIPLQKITAPLTNTFITNCKDITSKTTNTTITSNGLFELNGVRLKIDGDQEEVGLYFVAPDGTETKVQYLAQNSFKKVIGQAPVLAAGAYKIRIKTQATNTSGLFLKDIRISDATFTVTAA